MSNSLESIKYVKFNKARLKPNKRNENTSVILQYFKEYQGKEKGMKGFMILDSIEDSQESIVLTFWENKNDMDAFYQPDNKLLSNLVEKLKPAFEQLPERRDYQVVKVEI
jgi:heme-degrading monooxygenase HmoA